MGVLVVIGLALYCRCKGDWEGNRCQVRKSPDEEDLHQYDWVIGVVVLMGVLVVVGLVVGYTRYKRANR